MQDTSHLVALMTGLSNENARIALAQAKLVRATGRNASALKNELAHRAVWANQYQQQIDREYANLGMSTTVECELSEDDLLAELMA